MNRAAFDAGAIVLDTAEATAEPTADPVVARAYAHGAIPGRVVVRLVPEALRDGSDAEARVAGFTPTGTDLGVGRRRRRALGFPQWTLVHEPRHAALALSLVPELRKHARTAASKPGAARDGFVALAKTLERKAPSLLPTFHEQAARAFVDAGNPKLAATFFDKARAAEAAYGLAVDEVRRGDVFLEFALAGAVTVKSITAWLQEVGASGGAGAALERLVLLATGRTHGGLPPWASFGKDLARLAVAAGRDPAEVGARWLADVLGAPALDRMSAGAWQELDPAVRRLAADPSARRALAGRFPKGTTSRWDDTDDDFALAWLDRLHACGALAPGAVPDDWLARLLAWAPDHLGPVLLLLRAFGPSWSGREVRVDRDWIDPDWLDLLLEVGVTPRLGEDTTVWLRGWSGQAPVPGRWELSGEDRPRALRHVLAAPELREATLRSVPQALSQPSFARAARAHPELDAVRIEAVRGLLRQLREGPLGEAEDAVGTLEDLPYADLAEDPALGPDVRSADVAEALAASLRGGVLEELAWPAWEEALRELGDGDRTVGGGWPWVAVAVGRKAVVLGPDGQRCAAVDLSLPKGAELRAIRWLDGALLAGFTGDDGEQASWSTAPRDRFEADVPWYGDTATPAWPCPGGGVFVGGAVVHRGDRGWPPDATTFCDGESAWVLDDERLRAFDPATGRVGDGPAPSFLADVPPERRALARLGWTAAGPHGLRTVDGNRYETLDGFVWAGDDTPDWLGAWPGDAAPRAVAASWRGLSLFGADGREVDRTESDRLPPAWAWWHLRPRDPVASARLRSADAALARTLLGCAGEEDDDDAVAAAIAAAEPAVATLSAALVRPVRAARALADRLDTWRRGETADGDDAEEDGPTLRRWHAILGLASPDTSWDDVDLVRSMRARAAFLTGATDSAPHTLADGSVSGAGIRAVGWALARPLLAADDRAVVRAVLEAWAEAPPLRVRAVQWSFPDLTSPFLRTRTEGGEKRLLASWTVITEDTRFLVRTDDTWSDEGPFDVSTLSVGPSDPPGATNVSEQVEGPPDPADQAWIRALLAADPVAVWDPGAPDRVAAATGLSRAAAALLLIAGPNLDDYDRDFLGAELRELLGLKVKEATAGKDELLGLPVHLLRDVLAAAAPDDPADLARPPVEGLIAAFLALVGRRLPVDPELRSACEKLHGSDELLDWLGNPALQPWLTTDPIVKVDAELSITTEGDGEFLTIAHVRTAVRALPWVVGALPAGDPVRGNAARVVELLLQRLAAPGTWLAAGTTYLFEAKKARKVLDAMGGAADGDRRSLPGLRAALVDDDRLEVIVEPAAFGDEAHTALLALAAKADDAELSEAAHALSCVPRLRGWLDALRGEALPAGAYATDPRASVPDLVAEAARSRKLSTDAAALWLQTLALPNPTKKEVCTWNGWTPKVYDRAAAELVAAKLVLEAKRPRAGRAHFLPGAWVDGRPIPYERWKLPLLDGVEKRGVIHLPYDEETVLPWLPAEAFARAWKRVAAGDLPRFG